MSASRKYPGGVDGYARDAMRFHRLCYLVNDKIPLADIEQAVTDLLVTALGTRFEVFVREEMAMEYAERDLLDKAREWAHLALALSTPGYQSPRARQLLARIGEG